MAHAPKGPGLGLEVNDEVLGEVDFTIQ
jgi:hypothetical protein